jgi:hypothetical protein
MAARRTRCRRVLGFLAGATALAVVLAGCARTTDGSAVIVAAPNANLPVTGDSHGQFDTTVKNALSDVMAFWKLNYPKVSGGKTLPLLDGGLYSIDGDLVVANQGLSGRAADNGCLADDPGAVVDNAFYCQADDSIVWDRAADHLVPVLGAKYGPILVAMVFAHEFGHAIQRRLGTLEENLPTIDTESQADCASGAFLGSVLDGLAPHFRLTSAQLDEALNGYLLVRDQTPTDSGDISHGNGFDRLSAIDDGIAHGAIFCYRSTYFTRQFTERPFQTDTQNGIYDTQRGGNQPLSDVLKPASNTDPTQGLQQLLGRDRQDDQQSVPRGEVDAGGTPGLRRDRGKPVRLLPERQHRVLQHRLRHLRLLQLVEPEHRREHRQGLGGHAPTGRLRAGHPLRHRLGHGSTASALRREHD